MNQPSFNVREKLIEYSEDSVKPDGVLILDVIRYIYRPAQEWLATETGIVWEEFIRSRRWPGNSRRYPYASIYNTH